MLGFHTAGELAGRGLEVRQPGAGSKGGDLQAHSFAFDRVFAPQASQVGGTGFEWGGHAGTQAAAVLPDRQSHCVSALPSLCASHVPDFLGAET